MIIPLQYSNPDNHAIYYALPPQSFPPSSYAPHHQVTLTLVAQSASDVESDAADAEKEADSRENLDSIGHPRGIGQVRSLSRKICRPGLGLRVGVSVRVGVGVGVGVEA